jgi:alanyl-tRNA synthetase
LELEQQIDRVVGQLKDLRKSLQDTSQRLMEYDAARIWGQAEAISGVKVIVHNAGQGNMDTAKQFALKLAANPLTAAAVGSLGPDNAYLVVARSQDSSLDAAAAFKSAIALLEGKGGGNQGMAQGGGPRASSLDEALKTAYENLISQLA